MRICFDMDGVLASFENNVMLVANELWPERKLPLDYLNHDWDYSDIFTKKDWDDVWEKIRTIPDFWYREKEYPQAVYSLANFRKTNSDPIWFITSRMETGGVSARYQTQLWLMRHNLLNYREADKVIAVNKPEEKQKWIEELKIDISIDDLAPTVARHNTIPAHTAYLLNMPWNKECKDQPRVYSVFEFLNNIVVSKAMRKSLIFC